MSTRVGPHTPRVPSPVRGEQAPLVTTAASKQAAEVVAESKLAQVSLQDVDAFLRARAGQPQQRGGVGGLLRSLQSLLTGKPAAAPPSSTARAIQHDVRSAVAELTQVYADGRLTEAELGALSGAQERMEKVLALADRSVLDMLPRDVRERLETQLFEPLQVLMQAAQRRSGRVMGEVVQRDHEALSERLSNVQPRYAPYRPADVADRMTPANPQRYQVGDYVAVPRSDGSVVLGVVTGHEPEGLRVEVQRKPGEVGVKTLSVAELSRHNPFRIGDVIDIAGGRVWITGIANGKLQARVQDAAGTRDVGGAVRAGHPDHGYLEQLQTNFLAAGQQWIEVKQAQAQATTILAPVASSTASSAPQAHVFAGGAETTTPVSMQARSATGGLFTYRGVGYKDYNEDAAVLGVTHGKGGKEVVFAGAFDQAGGVGDGSGATGAASKAAADRFSEAVRKIAQGGDAKAALEEAGRLAHGDINSFGFEAATTFAAGVIVDGHALVMNCGDSGVVLVGKDGRVKAATDAHNLGDRIAKDTGDPNAGLHVANILTSCLGGSQSTPTLDTYRWPVEKGDRLVFVSDGVLDANLAAQKAAMQAGRPWRRTAGDVTHEEIGQLVARAGSAEAASQALIDYAKRQVDDGKGKRDNVTAVVVAVR